jgi:hypothetical protein
MDNYLLSLFAEYTTLVDTMRGGGYTPEEAHALDSARQVTHRELCQYTGKPIDFDMYRHARNALTDARRKGWT